MHVKVVTVNQRTHVIKIPDFCPHCGQIMELVVDHINVDDAFETYILLSHCSIATCHKFFALEYRMEHDLHNHPIIGELLEYQYTGFIEPDISKNIKEMSPIFAATFREAYFAETKMLKNISGLAFRKAFEFLVKDFAILKNPDDTETIKKQSLNNVIDMYYKAFPGIDKLLHIIRKLGNDETHYYRKYEDIDVSDLKNLINSFIHYIDMVLSIEEFSKKMN